MIEYRPFNSRFWDEVPIFAMGSIDQTGLNRTRGPGQDLERLVVSIETIAIHLHLRITRINCRSLLNRRSIQTTSIGTMDSIQLIDQTQTCLQLPSSSLNRRLYSDDLNRHDGFDLFNGKTQTCRRNPPSFLCWPSNPRLSSAIPRKLDAQLTPRIIKCSFSPTWPNETKLTRLDHQAVL